ncbi:MAG: hypothetical protein HY264_08465 [Chloroflexi bacterium]|nr:hypothetical protein [Chloroflexota bacterium]
MAAPVARARVRTLRDRLVRPTLPELWGFLAVALPAAFALIASLPTVDLAYQLRAGADILAGRGIPAVDAWTFTAAGQPWFDQQWLAQSFLAQTYQVAGWTGLAVLRAVLVAVIQGFILIAIRRRAPGLGTRTAALLAIAAFVVMAPALALRPQLFGMALFAGTLAVLAGRRERPAWWWLVPLAAVAWANEHGSFILAPLLVGLAWLEDLRDRWPGARRTLATLAATTVATVLTPFGPRVWQYAFGVATNHQVTTRISEWQPTRLTDVPGALFWLSVVAVAAIVVVIARRRRDVPWPAILALVVFAGLGAVAVRGIAWWPGIAAVTVAGLLGGGPRLGDQVPPLRPPRGSAINSVLAALIVVAGVAFLPLWRPTDPGTGAPVGLLGQAPSGITAALRGLATPVDRVWNPQVWGSWLEFAVPAPAYAFDARIEVIPAATWDLADTVDRAGPGWQGILDRLGVTIVVIAGDGTTPLDVAIGSDPGWREARADEDGTIWTRASR